MSYKSSTIKIAGVLTLALLAAGCSNGTGSMASPAGGIPPMATGSSQMNQSSGVAQRAANSCPLESNAQAFNNDKIMAGSTIWFTSVVDDPNAQVLRFHMAGSYIQFTANSKTFTIPVPAARISLHEQENLHLNFAGKEAKHGVWWLMAPYSAKGNFFMDGVAYKVTEDLPGGIDHVTWYAKFYSGKNYVDTHIQWRWAAAVYKQFADKYNDLAVKPLDDAAYPPKNNHPAGTPETQIAYVIDGATGKNGDFTGQLGPTVNVNTCSRK